MKKQTFILGTLMLLAIAPAIAKPSLNEMQTCQGLLEFITQMLTPTPAHYTPADIETVRQGLMAYNDYIQTEIITPGLLHYSEGDVDKANALQPQIDVFKESVIVALKNRYPGSHLVTDQVVAVNNCTKMAVPAGDKLAQLKDALTTMLALTTKS